MSCSVELRQRRQQGMAEDPHKLAAMMNKSQRLVLGLLILLLVDIIWVSSSELTKVRNLETCLLFIIAIFLPCLLLVQVLVTSLCINTLLFSIILV